MTETGGFSDFGSPVDRVSSSLAAANRARARRAAVKRALADGSLSFAEVMADPLNRRMRVEEALLAVPGYGPKKAEAIMAEVGISGATMFGGLTPLQREALSVELSRRPASDPATDGRSRAYRKVKQDG